MPHKRFLPGPLLRPVGLVFAVFLAVGAGIPVLPLHIRQSLGLGTVVVGLVSGSQFLAALFSRLWAGALADRFGVRKTLLLGLGLAVASACLYRASLQLLAWPLASVAVLLLGRIVLGVGESCVVVAALNWALTLAGPDHAGAAMSLVGTAMYSAYALGAPLGGYVYGASGFSAIAVLCALLPLLALLAVRHATVGPTASGAGHALSGRQVWRAVWRPGVGLALSGMGFTAMGTFAALWAAQSEWGPHWLAFAVFSLAFVATRLAGGHLPDRLGGARVAAVSALVEAVGLLCIWGAHDRPTLLAGAVLAGMGYALVFPGLGLVALAGVAPHARARAMGSYTVFLDMTLGFGTPLLGWLAASAGLRSVFLAAALGALASGLVCMGLSRRAAHATA